MMAGRQVLTEVNLQDTQKKFSRSVERQWVGIVNESNRQLASRVVLLVVDSHGISFRLDVTMFGLTKTCERMSLNPWSPENNAKVVVLTGVVCSRRWRM